MAPEQRLYEPGSLGPTLDAVRRVAMSLPRTEEHLIHGRVKFRIRSIVYVALSRRLNAIDAREMRALITEAWRMVVPRSVAAAYDGSGGGWRGNR